QNAGRILSVDHLTMRFGGLRAVDALSFEARHNEITAIIGPNEAGKTTGFRWRPFTARQNEIPPIIGPNGAGKTTVFNCITGFYRPTSGSIQLTHGDSAEIKLERLNDFRIAKRARVARTFQNIRLFPGMTALENLMVAQQIGRAS